MEKHKASDDKKELEMSLEEFKTNLFQSLRDNGTIDLLRAQLRRKVIEKLKKYSNQEDNNVYNDSDIQKMEANVHYKSIWTVDEKVANGLIQEYLMNKQLEHTTAVFMPEIGGQHQLFSVDTLVSEQELNQGNSLLMVFIKNIRQRLQTCTSVVGTQTSIDCQDHRIMLEHSLRHIDNAYLSMRENQRQIPERNIEERMIAYQRQLDALNDTKLAEAKEQFQRTTLQEMQMNERRHYEKELECQRQVFEANYKERLQQLKHREDRIETEVAIKKKQIEESLFSTRKSLFQEMESMRHSELQWKGQASLREVQLKAEEKRLAVWAEQLQSRECLIESTINTKVNEMTQIIRDKENFLDKRILEYEQKKEKIAVQFAAEKKMLDEEKATMRKRIDELSSQEAHFRETLDELNHSKNLIVQLEIEKKRIENDYKAKIAVIKVENQEMTTLSYENARLAAEVKVYEKEVSSLTSHIKDFEEKSRIKHDEVIHLQQEVIALKMSEADSVVVERRKLTDQLENYRRQSQWKESTFLNQLQELQNKLGESKAQSTRFENQYEEEKLCVAALREEVQHLNSLLTQTQTAMHPKRGLSGYQRIDSDTLSNSERTMMMKMMELMSSMNPNIHNKQLPLYAPEVINSRSSAPRNDSVFIDNAYPKNTQQIEHEMKVDACVSGPFDRNRTRNQYRNITNDNFETSNLVEVEHYQRQAKPQTTTANSYASPLDRTNEEISSSILSTNTTPKLKCDKVVSQCIDVHSQLQGGSEIEVNKNCLLPNTANKYDATVLSDINSLDRSREVNHDFDIKLHSSTLSSEANAYDIGLRQCTTLSTKIATRVSVPSPKQLANVETTFLEKDEEKLPGSRNQSDNTQDNQLLPNITISQSDNLEIELEKVHTMSGSHYTSSKQHVSSTNVTSSEDKERKTDPDRDTIVVSGNISEEQQFQSTTWDELKEINDIHMTTCIAIPEIPIAIDVTGQSNFPSVCSSEVVSSNAPKLNSQKLDGSAHVDANDQKGADIVQFKLSETEKRDNEINEALKKQQEDDSFMDVYRQRVLARKAAEKQRQQLQLEEQKRTEQENTTRACKNNETNNPLTNDNELELSSSSVFAESSVESDSSF